MPTWWQESNGFCKSEDAPYWRSSRRTTCQRQNLNGQAALSCDSGDSLDFNTHTQTHRLRAYAPHARLHILLFFFPSSHEGTCRGPGITQNALPCIVWLFLSVHVRGAGERGEVERLGGVRGSLSLPRDGSGPFTASILLSPRPLSPRATLSFLSSACECISECVCVCAQVRAHVSVLVCKGEPRT